jgi:Fe-S cluster biogenesis protein NfuA
MNPVSAGSGSVTPVDVRELPARIEALLDEAATFGDQAAGCAEQLVAAVLTLYGAGLERILELVGDEQGGDAVVRRLAADPMVSNLLLLHDLHPDDIDTRIQQALDRVRPYLGSHAGGIDYIGVDDVGIAHLQLQGSCDGCAGSAATVHNAVERAVLEAAPELLGVEVEGVVEEKPKQLLQISLRCPDGLIEAVST